MIGLLARRLALVNCIAFSSLIYISGVLASANMHESNDRLRNPFVFAPMLKSLHPRVPAPVAPQLTSARLVRWQVKDLVLVGTLARAGVTQGLIRDPQDMIHIISVGDTLTDARLRVVKIDAQGLVLFPEQRVIPTQDSGDETGDRKTNSDAAVELVLQLSPTLTFKPAQVLPKGVGPQTSLGFKRRQELPTRQGLRRRQIFPRKLLFSNVSAGSSEISFIEEYAFEPRRDGVGRWCSISIKDQLLKVGRAEATV